MKKTVVLLAAALSLLGCTLALAQGPAVPSDARKHTVLGKYVNAMEAYVLYRSKPGEVKVLDVRTPEEYDFVGHVPWAVNVPLALWTGTFDPERGSYILDANKKFVAQVAARFAKTDTILVYCRSGQRSAAAVNALAAAGFTNAYSVTDGFEGDAVAEADSVFQGKRAKNGWKNWGLPWTNALDPKLVYTGK